MNVGVNVLVNAGEGLLSHGAALRIRDRKLPAGKGSVNAGVCYGNENVQPAKYYRARARDNWSGMFYIGNRLGANHIYPQEKLQTAANRQRTGSVQWRATSCAKKME